jgi:hypothetical protein
MSSAVFYTKLSAAPTFACEFCSIKFKGAGVSSWCPDYESLIPSASSEFKDDGVSTMGTL